MSTNSQVAFSGITIAVKDMDRMKNFYSKVLSLDFEKIELPDNHGTIYSGSCYPIQVQLCPLQISGVSGRDYRHQIEFKIPDVSKAISTIKKNGGRLRNKFVPGMVTISVFDPDGNSLVLSLNR